MNNNKIEKFLKLNHRTCKLIVKDTLAKFVIENQYKVQRSIEA